VRVAEEDLQSGGNAKFGVLGHLRALIPGQRPAQLLGQRGDGRGDRVSDGFGAVPGQRRPVLDSQLLFFSGHGWQVQEHCEPGAAFHQGADRRAVQAEDEVAFPMTGNGPVLDLRGPFADHDLVSDEVLAPARAGTGDA
jgi:hypothetical protein